MSGSQEFVRHSRELCRRRRVSVPLFSLFQVTFPELTFLNARRPASVIRIRTISTVRPPTTTRSAVAVASPARTSSTSLRRGSRGCRGDRLRSNHFPQSSSASRFRAGAFGFFIFNQSGDRPKR
jgi:hypothetical protein